MFTGIVEEVGTLVVRDDQGDSARLQLRGAKTLEGVALGDSIAVNGVCLTVTAVEVVCKGGTNGNEPSELGPFRAALKVQHDRRVEYGRFDHAASREVLRRTSA